MANEKNIVLIFASTQAHQHHSEEIRKLAAEVRSKGSRALLRAYLNEPEFEDCDEVILLGDREEYRAFFEAQKIPVTVLDDPAAQPPADGDGDGEPNTAKGKGAKGKGGKKAAENGNSDADNEPDPLDEELAKMDRAQLIEIVTADGSEAPGDNVSDDDLRARAKAIMSPNE